MGVEATNLSSAPTRRCARPAQYQRLAGPHGEAVVCVAPEQPVALMLDLLRHIDGPLVALYLLLEDCGGPPPARYQSPVPTGRRELRRFLERFAEFLEQDGRHAFWIMNARCSQRLIFDRHDLVFAYGRLDAFEQILVRRGYAPGRPAAFPADHRLIDPRFDAEADRLHEWWTWFPVPLYPGDEL